MGRTFQGKREAHRLLYTELQVVGRHQNCETSARSRRTEEWEAAWAAWCSSATVKLPTPLLFQWSGPSIITTVWIPKQLLSEGWRESWLEINHSNALKRKERSDTF